MSGAFCSSSNHSFRSPFSHLGQFRLFESPEFCGFLKRWSRFIHDAALAGTLTALGLLPGQAMGTL